MASDVRNHNKIKESKILRQKRRKIYRRFGVPADLILPIENQAGERVGVVNHFRLLSHRPATPIVQGFIGIPTFHFWRVCKIISANRIGVVKAESPKKIKTFIEAVARW